MLFSNHPRMHYGLPPAHEVICQLRFPTILSINHVEPADFQEAIRDEFPQYLRRQDAVAPKIVNDKLEQQLPMTNYHFLSADGKWKLNMTRDFISLSTLSYTGWETFARMLDKPLATFIQLYHPAYFQRVGLRYLNVFSRSKLGLTQVPWSDLFSPAFLGPLCDPSLPENTILRAGVDFQAKLDSSCQVKLHAGPGRLKAGAPGSAQDPELQFVLDQDLFMLGNTPCTLAAASLETLHGHAVRVFESAVTQRLREAMKPMA